jgi:hypothetical protein
MKLNIQTSNKGWHIADYMSNPLSILVNWLVLMVMFIIYFHHHYSGDLASGLSVFVAPILGGIMSLLAYGMVVFVRWISK